MAGRRPGAHRGTGPHERRRSAPGVGTGQEAPAGRDGHLGSGNHYLEVQEVTRIYDPAIAADFGLREGAIEVSIHCGSRGLGHQIGTEYLKRMALAASHHGIRLPDLELACAPSTPTWAAPTSAPCGPPSIAPWPIARSSPT